MLAAHRDQENRVRSQHGTANKAPKTPGARYPKTPLGLTQQNENMHGGLVAKSGALGTLRNGNQYTKPHGSRGAPTATPLNTRPRAPLGNKTTNAKARPDQSNIVKDGVSEIAKTQLKSAVSQKQKQRSTEFATSKFIVQPDRGVEEEEPEYAPPPPPALPYESDVLPEGGLTFEGLKKKNLFKGYYEHFYNPIDENGVSRREKEFNLEMDAVVEQAIEKNEQVSDSLDWSVADVPETAKLFSKRETKSQPHTAPAPVLKATGNCSAPSIASRRAASALAIGPDLKRPTPSRPNTAVNSTKRSLPQAAPGNRTARTSRQSPADVTTAGEAASRTTLGYNKGRTASSLIRPYKIAATGQPQSAPHANDGVGRAVSPAGLQRANNDHGNITDSSRPKFMSIFYDDEDTDLPSPEVPKALLDEEEEEDFVLQLDV